MRADSLGAVRDMSKLQTVLLFKSMKSTPNLPVVVLLVFKSNKKSQRLCSLVATISRKKLETANSSLETGGYYLVFTVPWF